MVTRILTVDDSSLILTLVQKMLAQAGYEVITSTSGPDALARVKNIQPDLVILDVNMPEMNGYEVCRHLRQDPVTGQIPIMMLTAMDSLEYKLKGFEAGADDYMVKPFQGAELQVRVEALLRRSGATKPTALQPKAQVIAVFSLRGGVGISTLAANLAVGLAQVWGQPAALVDLALTLGQAALMLNLPLRHTWANLSTVSLQEIDANLLDRLLLQHSSGLRILAAPWHPEESAKIATDKVAHTLGVLCQSHAYVVLDLPHDLQDRTLAGLDAAHTILAVMAPELASVRAMSSMLDVFDMLEYPRDRIRMILNHTVERHALARREIEATLKRTFDLEVPFAPELFVQAVNTGTPPTLEPASSQVGGLLEDYAFALSQQEQGAKQPEPVTPAWKRIARRAEKRQGKK
jgi:pilus assembly protein CpaE